MDFAGRHAPPRAIRAGARAAGRGRCMWRGRRRPPGDGSRMCWAVLTFWSAYCHGYVYQPAIGQIWDPSVLYWNSSFWAISMYSPNGDKKYPSGFLSRSEDGVHWLDVGPIAPSHPNCSWWKGFPLQRPDGTFVLNHGVYDTHGADNTTRDGNDALRILTSRNLQNWTEVATSKPDAQWYKPNRWDHMYMKRVNGSYVGFPVSEPINATRFAGTWPGVQHSPDGVAWTAAAPLEVRWGDIAPQGIEEGGIERLTLPNGTSRYFLIGGQGGGGGCYQMWSFVSDEDSLMGPYSPTQRRFRLSGGLGGWGTCYSFGGLGAWVPPSAHSEALISQYITPHGGSAGRYDVWLLPMRKPVAAQQADGTPFLRLGYWQGNDRLCGASLRPTPPSTVEVNCNTGGSHSIAWIAEIDATTHSSGAYAAANLSANQEGLAVGFAIETPGSTTESTVILLTVGHESDTDPAATNATILRVDSSRGSVPDIIDIAGAFACGGKQNTICGVASITSITPRTNHAARLFLRRGMFELFVDELLVVSHVYPYKSDWNASGRIGLAMMCNNASAAPSHASLSDLTVGKLTLNASL